MSREIYNEFYVNTAANNMANYEEVYWHKNFKEKKEQRNKTKVKLKDLEEKLSWVKSQDYNKSETEKRLEAEFLWYIECDSQESWEDFTLRLHKERRKLAFECEANNVRYEKIKNYDDINKWNDLWKNPDFAQKANEMCDELWINLRDLKRVMRKESKLNPQAVNSNSWATWLIQFMPKTAIWLWTTVEELYNMTWVEQLEYVKKYYEQFDHLDLSNINNLYLSTFYPKAMWKDNDYVIWWNKVARQNPGIAKYSDREDWKITVAAVKAFINDTYA